jgi:hypothetical protein
MYDVSNTTGPHGYGEASGEVGDSADPLTGKAFFQDLIRRANTVPLIRIFKYYKLHINEGNRRIICPLKSHKGGRESSGSFWFYPETNSFYCFGCKVGGPWAHSCEFVSFIENISKAKAAYKIFELFSSDVGDVGDNEQFEIENNSERLEIMMSFSTAVMEFRQTYFDEESYSYIEYVCSVYDRENLRHKKLDNNTLRRIVDRMKEDLSTYKG